MLCLCGCVQETKLGNKYINTHHTKNRILSKETRKKISISKMGNKNPMIKKKLEKMLGLEIVICVKNVE